MVGEQQSREPCQGKFEFRTKVPNVYAVLSLDWFRSAVFPIQLSP